MSEVPITFINDFQRRAFACTKRNICDSGGYGNGKTSIAEEKLILLAATFPKYRCGIFRKKATELKDTTMKTFYKFCPPELYASPRGRRSDNFGELRLINDSEFLFMHLEKVDEGLVRGLELNSAFIDQGEEIDENIYLHLDTRVGRWDQAEIPPHLQHLPFPISEVTGKQIPPSYMIVGCNPDHLLHWIYQRYHPDSEEHWKVRYDDDGTAYTYAETHEMFQADSRDNPALDKNTLRAMMQKDETYIRRFVKGIWGIPEGSIHEIHKDSIIQDPDTDFIRMLRRRGALVRVMDHGETSPTCVIWVAQWRNCHFFFQEYYKPNTLISEHRQNIYDLSLQDDGTPDNYLGSFADPSIFSRRGQKQGSFWTTAEEYTDSSYKSPPISWQPADNNEARSRNRLNEILAFDPDLVNPLTGEKGSPRAFFLMASSQHPTGCNNLVSQIRAQKRKQIGTLNGTPVFSDERDDEVVDHAYDTARYYANSQILHTTIVHAEKIPGSFMSLRKRAIEKMGKRRLIYA